MKLEEARVKTHAPLTPDYRMLELESPEIARDSQPGQFIHLKVPRLDDALLRRPFSILDARDGIVSLLYKAVGKGTTAMLDLQVGDGVSVLGPLGNGFPVPVADIFPILVAGGYGVAPMKFLASRMSQKGALFIGGRSERDIFLDDVVGAMGWEVHVTTEDGSRGGKGRITLAVDEWLAEKGAGKRIEIFVCGPDGLLHAMSERAVAQKRTAWISMDRNMGCGVGACLACVQKVKQPDGNVVWARICTEGPVLPAEDIVW